MNAHRLSIVLLLIYLIVPNAVLGSTQAYEKGMESIQDGNFAEAYFYWRPLADAGDLESQYNVGWMYANGLGLNVNVLEAIRWWKKAAKKGHAPAKFSIGLAYLNGDGVKTDDEQAIEWMLSAASTGYEDGQDILRRLILQRESAAIAQLAELGKQSWFTDKILVTGESVNLRKGPGTSHAIVGKTRKGEKLAAIGKRGKWVAILLPGDELGWVFANLVEI